MPFEKPGNGIWSQSMSNTPTSGAKVGKSKIFATSSSSRKRPVNLSREATESDAAYIPTDLNEPHAIMGNCVVAKLESMELAAQ